MIKQVQLKNFRCFRDTTVDLEPFTVLIGKNDTGKTSLLEAIHWCVHSLQRTPSFNPSELTGVVRAGQDVSSLRVSVELGEGCSVVLAERVQAALGPKLPSNALEAQFAKRLARFSPPPYRLRPSELRKATKVGGDFTSNPLGPLGTGLAAVLDRILSERREVFYQIETGLKVRLPTVEWLRLRPQSSNKSAKEVGFDLRSGAKLGAGQVSDGTMLMLAFLTIVHDEKAPPLLMVEEPENGIHPKQLREVLRLLYSLTQREEDPIQVILTTHSPYVLDFVPANSIRVFRRDSESGDVEVLPFADVAPIKEMLEGGLTPGEAWYNSDEDEFKEVQDAGIRGQ